MLSVYKLFRIIYNANPHNDQKLFRIPKVIANDSANAIVSMAEVTEHLYNKECNGKVVIDDTLKAAIDAYYEQYGAK